MTDNSSITQGSSAEASSDRPICGFWVRVLALIIDIILLGVVGRWDRIVGLVIVLGYFGFLNSHIGRGQTIGKRIVRIRVVGDNGQYVSLPRSLLRTIILWIPYFPGSLLIPHFLGYFSGSQIFSPISISPIGLLVSSVGIGLCVGIAYLYLFNRQTRQSLHDLIVNSYVVRATVSGEISVGPIARVHYVVFGALVVASVAFIGAHRIARRELYSGVLIVQRNLNQVEGFLRLEHVEVGKELVAVEVAWKDEPASFDTAIDKVARVVLDSYPDIESKDEMRIGVFYVYSVGILSSKLRGDVEAYSPAEWRNRLGGK